MNSPLAVYADHSSAGVLNPQAATIESSMKVREVCELSLYTVSGAHEGKKRLTHYCMCSLTDQGYCTYWNTSNFLVWKVL